LIAATVTIAFVAASIIPQVGKVLPPVLIALVVGFAVVIANGQLTPAQPIELGLVQPMWFVPSFSIQAQVELVIPLIVTVIGIHNPQGFAVLSEAKYVAPVNAMTFASGIGSVASAFVGGGSICVAGPSNALLCSSGQPDQRYVGGIVFGLLMLAFGIAAPMAVSLALMLPATFISVLGGLAILRVLQGWMASAFGGALGLGALVAFLVTMSGIVVFHISAPFWGVVAGMATSLLLERPALRQSWAKEMP
jgi:benzoate membrane transport protein